MVELYLMSIKPKFVYRLFTGIKKYELRRYLGIKPTVGSIIVVYASYPIQSILGEFVVSEILEGKPEYVFNVLSKKRGCGIGEEDYSYVKTAKYCLAIGVGKRIIYYKPVKLRVIQDIIPSFQPPFSMRELSEDEPLYRLILRKVREYTYSLLSNKNFI